MQPGDDDAPLLTRDDLRVAALRAALVAPLLVAWSLAFAARRGRSAVALGLGLAAVVAVAALLERFGRRRGWAPARTALVVWLGALVAGFAAALQARGSGLDLLRDGAGGARVDAALGRVVLDRVQDALRLPASLAALVAGFGLAIDGRARGAPRDVVAVVWLICAGLWYPALWLVMGPVGAADERALLLLHAVTAAAVLLLVVSPRGARLMAAGTARFPVRDGWFDGLDLALVGLAFVVLVAPRAGRVAHEVRRASAASEAERLFQAALALDDPRGALAALDASLTLVDDPRGRLARGRLRAAQGDVAGAEVDLEQASLPSPGVDPGDRVEALATWGDAVFLDYDRALTAIDKYSRAIELLDADPALAVEHAGALRHALRRRAALHVMLRDDLLVRRDADRLLEAELGAPDAWLRRGVLRALTDDAAGARTDLARAAAAGAEEGAVWLAALYGHGDERLEALAARPGLLGEAARALAPRSSATPAVIAPDERALLVAASAAGGSDAAAVDEALATALAWLGAQAERAGDTTRARARYASALAACARRAGAQVRRPGPGEHVGRLWAWRRLEALGGAGGG